jgi:hypothetical protein
VLFFWVWKTVKRQLRILLDKMWLELSKYGYSAPVSRIEIC